MDGTVSAGAKPKQNYVSINDKTHPILAEAGKLMLSYSRATGARVCVNDYNSMPIQELLPELTSDKNLCIFCMKHRENIDVKDIRDFRYHPCRDKHGNAAKDAERCGGSLTYTCDLGQVFWTSPIYINKHFIGALQGTGFWGIDKKDAVARLNSLCDGTVPEEELQKIADSYPRAVPRKIKALSELVLICAKSLSSGSEESYSAMRRRAQQQSDITARVEVLKNKYPAGEKRPEYPLDMERKLLDALRMGDTHTARETMNELLAFLFFSCSEASAEVPDQKSAKDKERGERCTAQTQFKNIKYRASELAVLLNRLDIGPGFNSQIIIEKNKQYINAIQEARNMEELTDALYHIVDNMAGQIFSFQGVRHAAALKKAEYYIKENFNGKISLKDIAKVAGFSVPYFSTIFKEEMGENFSSYINRLRVEKASCMLTETNFPMSAISGACGFEDQSWFSKIFKIYTGMSPGKFRSQGGKTKTKVTETEFSDDYKLMSGH